MDRNKGLESANINRAVSLSARRAWIEMVKRTSGQLEQDVALRKESVDRNICAVVNRNMYKTSLSRRAWIEI